ncbi:hypothetical protein AAC387_Pa09g1339 [Persea americana]
MASENQSSSCSEKFAIEVTMIIIPASTRLDRSGASLGSKFLLALDKRSTKECGQERIRASPGSPSVKAF